MNQTGDFDAYRTTSAAARMAATVALMVVAGTLVIGAPPFARDALAQSADVSASLGAGSAHPAQDRPPRSITVLGEAEVRVVPDEVVLTLGVETMNLDLAAAKQENDRLVSAVIAAAVEVGVPAQRVQTDHVQIEPRYEEQRTRRDFIGYFVRKTIVITLREPERFDALLGQVLEAGANYVHGIQFRTTDLRNQRDYARKLAIHAAREKAEDLATELDQRIGLPLSITEESGGAWYWYNDTWGGRWGGGWMSQNVVQSVGGGPSSLDGGFALGEISVTARIRATFELE